MTSLFVVGADPGPVPGIGGLFYRDGALIDYSLFQCNADMAPWLIRHLLGGTYMEVPSQAPTLIFAYEQFILGPRASRSGTPQAGKATRDQIGLYAELGSNWPQVHTFTRTAAAVKLWATDVRLDKAGLLEPAKAVGRHCVDGVRHALMAAVRDGGVPDPLSRRARSGGN